MSKLVSILLPLLYLVPNFAKATQEKSAKEPCGQLIESAQINLREWQPTNLKALLKPGVFDQTRLIYVNVEANQLGPQLIEAIKRDYTPVFGKDGKTVEALKWTEMDHLYSHGPFGANAYSSFKGEGGSTGTAQFLSNPFERVEPIHEARLKRTASDILFIILDPLKPVYEQNIFFDVLDRRHNHFRTFGGARQSTVIIGGPADNKTWHEISMSFMLQIELINARASSGKRAVPKIQNSGKSQISIDTWVPSPYANDWGH